MKSALYSGHVAHNRPGEHRLRYSVFMLAVDLDELSTLNLGLLKHNRGALFSLKDRDHAARADAPLKPQIEAKLRDTGIAWDGGRIVMLTMPRLFNYVFNPLTVYFCTRRDGELAALVHEVANTFGEQHFYVLPPARRDNGVVTQSCTKDFFVSPFLEMDLRYEFHILPPGEDVTVAMIVKRGAQIALTASFAGKRRELNDATLFRVWLGNPLMTFKVIAGIHWEALKMMLKGVRFIGRHGARANPQTKAAA
ncbi:MAG TPA: DUF1365 domain-containing protein [Verrucomicrobiae bacterium]|nr:DUF1365 domain-containing protein [Verrucomicrobiae bacterium]